MDQILSKAKQWIDEKKDPRSAHWQAGLEAFMELVSPHLEKGCLTPVAPLDENDLPVFNAALERVDLSPGLLAAFLPPCVADPIFPPDSIEELMRIKKEKPSYKIIIQRPGQENRILCAEISKHAHRPGVDIFQSGAFLGNFDYDTHDACIMELTRVIRTHGWEKHKWQREDYLAYTLNWFKNTVFLGKPDVSVDIQYSFFHSPTLVKMNRVDALFLLLYKMVHHGFNEDQENLHKSLSIARQNSKNKEERILAWESIAEQSLLSLLNLIRNLGLMDFADFTNAENHRFQNEFVRTVRKLSSDLDKMEINYEIQT